MLVQAKDSLLFTFFSWRDMFSQIEANGLFAGIVLSMLHDGKCRYSIYSSGITFNVKGINQANYVVIFLNILFQNAKV